MNCLKVQSLLSEHLDGNLSGERAESVDRHLEHCPACAAEWRALRATVRLVGHLGRLECPVDLRPAVVNAVARRPVRRAGSIYLQRALAVIVGGSAIAACLSLPVVLRTAALSDGTSFHRAARPVVAPAPPVHTQYKIATVLGPTDGLMLSLSSHQAVPAVGKAGDDAR